jgi:hypothetical protein
MKKLLSLSLILILIVFLASCGKSADDVKTTFTVGHVVYTL